MLRSLAGWPCVSCGRVGVSGWTCARGQCGVAASEFHCEGTIIQILSVPVPVLDAYALLNR
eukprot:6652331-Alexandrium_andersonii.AAC.1